LPVQKYRYPRCFVPHQLSHCFLGTNPYHTALFRACDALL
jgi:hypothetical protein